MFHTCQVVGNGISEPSTVCYQQPFTCCHRGNGRSSHHKVRCNESIASNGEKRHKIIGVGIFLGLPYVLQMEACITANYLQKIYTSAQFHFIHDPIPLIQNHSGALPPCLTPRPVSLSDFPRKLDQQKCPTTLISNAQGCAGGQEIFAS